MAEHWVPAKEADRVAYEQAKPLWLMPADLREPTSERVIRAISRWAGIGSFVVALGAVGLWLLG